MIFSTGGIVLRSVKYGDTSAVVTIYTREFGLQSYMVNGVRSGAKGLKEHLYQPASILEMQAYHNPLKNLQRIREAEWKKVYHHIFSDVERHTAALLIVEIMQKTILQEEQHYPLYDFAVKMLLELDALPAALAANIPLLFATKWPALLGFQVRNNFSESRPYFDVREGAFVDIDSAATPEDGRQVNSILSSVLKASTVAETGDLKLNGLMRRKILALMEQYFKWHIDGFRELNTLRIIL